MRTNEFGNPTLSGETLLSEGRGAGSKVMTRTGVVFWLTIYLAILLGTAGITWSAAYKAFNGFDFSTLKTVETGEKDSDGKAITKTVVIDKSGEQYSVPTFDLSKVSRLMWIGLIGGLITGLIGIFFKQGAYFFGPLYAAFEGLALGGLSALFEVQFHGITMQAFALTIAVLLVMLALFATGILRATPMFVGGVLACMFGILGVYALDLIMGIWGKNLSLVHSTGWVGIGFSLFVCVIAAFNFIIDFESVEEGVRGRAPSYMNAYAAFGILITLVWLYVEILRLLAKARSKK